MEKLVVRVALFRRGVRKFQEEINAELSCGWKLDNLQIMRVGLFRILCIALLVRSCCEEEV